MSSLTVTYFARWISLFHFFCFLLHRDPLTKNTDCIDLFKKDFWNMKQYFEDQKEPALLFLPQPTRSVRTMLQILCVQIWISKLRVVSPRAHQITQPKAHLFLMAVGVRYMEYSLCITLIGFSGLSCKADAARRRTTPLISLPVLTSVCSYFSTASNFLFDLVLPA